MNNLDTKYQQLLSDIIQFGVEKKDRTGTGTISLFGKQIRHKMSEGFPLLTTKKMYWKGVVAELLWFLKGDTNIKFLVDNDCNIWNGDAYKNYSSQVQPWEPHLDMEMFIERIKTKPEFAEKFGYLGPIYGAQWRSWKVEDNGQEPPYYKETQIDQIANLINDLKTNPDSRRLMVSAWNVGEIENMALPPCHALFQFYVSPANVLKGEKKGKLSCQLYQRSADIFLGVPFNIASYALLTMMIAQVCDLQVGEFVHVLGDAHIYLNHLEQVKEQLQREPLPAPQLWLNPNIKDINKFTMADIRLDNYNSHSAIKAEMAV